MPTEPARHETKTRARAGRLRRIRPRDYLNAPELVPPAAYICVLRDPSAEAYRIESTGNPSALIDKLMTQGDFQFGIEFVALVATDDLASTEAHLDEKHGAALSSDWLNFDEHQVAALDRSALVAHTRNGFYIFPEKKAAARRAVRSRRSVDRYWSGSDRRRRQTSSYWDGDPLPDEELDPILSFLTSKRVEIGFKIALVVLAVFLALARSG